MRLAYRLPALVALALAATGPLAPAALAQPEPVDARAVTAIRQHGLDSSRVMETLAWMTDVYGPRLTGSPGLDAATRWAQDYLRAQGFANVRAEAWGPFGRGWSLRRFAMNASFTAPGRRDATSFPVHAFPKAWSPSVRGTGEVVVFDAESEADFARFRGRLRGKVVLLEPMRAVSEHFEAEARRHDDAALLGMANYVAAADQPAVSAPPNAMRQLSLNAQRLQFLAGEAPLAILDRNVKGDYGTIFVAGAAVAAPVGATFENRPTAWNPRGQAVLPQFTASVEAYNRLYRLAQRGLPVSVTLDLDAAYDESNAMEENVFAEIAGSDKADELVMLGAHFDSWHAGTGTTDNGAGSAVMMEAMRILQRTFADLGTRPRRTIRFALWTGEEQGLLGSRAYVGEHFGRRGPDGALQTTADHAKVAGYFNLDNGTGKIRGVYLQGNEGVAPLFRAWLRPFGDLGASTLTLQNTGGTDHLAFDAVGIPGFQFIQEPIAYATKTHHSNMDVLDHAVGDDLKQAATIIAAFVYHTAMREAPLPRKAPPTAAARPAAAPATPAPRTGSN